MKLRRKKERKVQEKGKDKSVSDKEEVVDGSANGELKEEQDGENSENAEDRESDKDDVKEADRDKGESKQIAELKARCDALEESLKESNEKYLRALADYENFKRRSLKERSDLVRYQGEKIFSDLLEIIDNLERAVENIEADPKDLRDGIKLIYKALLDLLSSHGVRGESAVGGKFDPTKHAALRRVETGDCEPGKVLSELQKAYFYRDKLLREAKVVVAAEPAEGEEHADSGQEQEDGLGGEAPGGEADPGEDVSG